MNGLPDVVAGLVALRREEPDFTLTAAMAYLAIVTMPAGVTATNLDALLQLDHGTMSRTIAQLVDRELIRRERDIHDRRLYRIHLSKRGSALATVIGRAMQAEVAR